MEGKRLTKEQKREAEEASRVQDEKIKNGTWDEKIDGKMPPRGIFTPGQNESKYENKICIGLPHMGSFPWNTTMALLSLRLPAGYKGMYHAIGSSLVYDARDKIVKFARKEKCKYIMMMDSDMVPPIDMLTKMTALLDSHKEIGMVSGMMTRRTPPFQPCVYADLEYNMETLEPKLSAPYVFPDEGIMPIAGMGMACCLIRTEIFDLIDEKRPKNAINRASYFFPLPNLGEDLTFCLLARKCGVRMVCDLSISVGHVSAMPVDREHYRACFNEFEQKQEDGKTASIFLDGEDGA